MAPEYAMQGHFSTKSDVFSFGVLILEIVTGQRIGDFHGSGCATNLLSYVRTRKLLPSLLIYVAKYGRYKGEGSCSLFFIVIHVVDCLLSRSGSTGAKI